MIRAVAYAIKRRDVDMPSAKKKEGGGGWEMMEPPRSQPDMCAVWGFEHEVEKDNGEREREML